MSKANAAAVFGCVYAFADAYGEKHEMKRKNLKLSTILGGFTLLIAAIPANAGEGFSIGASAARAAIDVNEVGIDVEGDASGYRLFGLYMFNEKFGIEAGYSMFGEPNDSTIPARLHVETVSYDVFAVGTLPLSANFGLIAKAGFSSSKTDTELGDDDDTETSQSSTDLALSFGGQYEFNERFAIRGELEWIDNKDSGLSNMISLGGVFKFK